MTDFDQSIVKKAVEARLHDSDLLEHRDLKTKRFEDIKNEWFYYSLSYLTATNTLVNFAIKNRNIDARMHILPAVYNFKHSIELSLKFLYKNTDTDFKKNHDIVELYKTLIEKLKKHSGLQIKKFIKSDKTIPLTEEQVDRQITKAIEDLEGIVNKYYFQTPLQKMLKKENFFIVDHGNELFKYPEAQNVTFYFQSLSMVNIPENDLELIKLDIEKMTFVIRLFFTLFNPKSAEQEKAI